MSQKKEWPADNKPADFEDLMKEVVKAIKFAYRLERKNRGKNIPLVGPDAPASGPVASSSEMLSAESLRYAQTKGRSAIDEIVAVAIQLGIEQGRRISLDSGEAYRFKQLLDITELESREIKAVRRKGEMK